MVVSPREVASVHQRRRRHHRWCRQVPSTLTPKCMMFVLYHMASRRTILMHMPVPAHRRLLGITRRRCRLWCLVPPSPPPVQLHHPCLWVCQAASHNITLRFTRVWAHRRLLDPSATHNTICITCHRHRLWHLAPQRRLLCLAPPSVQLLHLWLRGLQAAPCSTILRCTPVWARRRLLDP